MILKIKTKTGFKLLFLVSGLGIILLIIAQVYRPFEPHANGKALTWLTYDYMDCNINDPDYTSKKLKQKNAEAAIRRMGTNALPFALNMIRSKESQVFLFGLHNPDLGVAVYEILGEEAKPSLPDLALILQSHDTFTFDPAMRAMRGIGNSAIPTLIDLLAAEVSPGQSNSAVLQGRANAAICIGEFFRRQASNAVPVLLKRLNDGDAYLQEKSLEALMPFHDDPRVTPALIEFLDRATNKSATISNVIFHLGYLGTNGRPFIPFLVKQARGDALSTAYHSLYKIAPEIATPIFEQWRSTNVGYLLTHSNDLEYIHSQTNAPAATNAPAEK